MPEGEGGEAEEDGGGGGLTGMKAVYIAYGEGFPCPACVKVSSCP